MCTVTYVPLNFPALKHLESQSKGFLLTSNRDEKTARVSAHMPEIFHIGNQKVAIPLDPEGKGSWIAVAENGNTVCLLNGAFEPHFVNPPYKHSRGLVVTKFFSFRCLQDFMRFFDFEEIEPFTLVIVEDEKLYELRWDGSQLHHLEMNAHESHIWSSVTLYSPDVRLKREWLYNDWLTKNYASLLSDSDLILDFHQFKKEEQGSESIEINRNNLLRTVSITSVKVIEKAVSLKYKDLINDQNETIRLGIRSLTGTLH